MAQGLVHLTTLVLVMYLRLCSPTSSGSSTYDTQLHSAIIIEPRVHPLLLPVIDNVLTHVPHATLLQVFHGSANKGQLQQHYARLIREGRVILHDLNVFMGSDIGNGSVTMQNNLYFNISFWQQCRGENLLTFEVDTCLCSKSPWRWDNFFGSGRGWGWIGAPHTVITGGVNGARTHLRLMHQNGGLALRRKSLLIEVLKNNTRFWISRQEKKQTYNEDVFFSLMHRVPMQVAPFEVARKFSVERHFNPTPFGLHKAWCCMTPWELRILQKTCPELHTLFGVVPPPGVNLPSPDRPEPEPAGLPPLDPMALDRHLHSAIIVETRAHSLLLPVVDHMLTQLPNATVVQVFHSPLNERMLRQHYAPLIRQGRVRLTDLRGLLGSEVSRWSRTTLNRLHYNTSFWRQCQGENLLIFQVDSCVCSKSPFTWDDFVGQGWGWVGPPRVVSAGKKKSAMLMPHQSGGLTLRSKNLTITVLEQDPTFVDGRGATFSADLFFSERHAKRMRRAELPIASAFVVSTYFYPTPFAVYKPWTHMGMKADQLRTLQQACPELHTLFGVVPAPGAGRGRGREGGNTTRAHNQTHSLNGRPRGKRITGSGHVGQRRAPNGLEEAGGTSPRVASSTEGGSSTNPLLQTRGNA